MADARTTPKASKRTEDQFQLLANVLHAAAYTDEPGEHSGNSSRLLRIGSELAAAQVDGHNPHDPASRAYDIAALVAASQRAPGDQDPTEGRVDLVAHAGRILKGLAGHEGDDILADDELLSAKAMLRSGRAPVRNRFNGAQQRIALMTIATRMSTLNRLLMMVQTGTPGSYESGLALDAAQSMAEGIGAMADEVSEAGIFDSPHVWNCGPAFTEAGKAGAA